MLLEKFEQLPRKAQKTFLNDLDINEAIDFTYEVHAKIFWSMRQPNWYPTFTYWAKRRLLRLVNLLNARIENNLVKPETNKNGASVIREKCFDISLFFTTYLHSKKGDSIFQDGSSACIAVDSELSIYTYCEGDVVITRCPSERIYNLEKNEAQNFYACEY
ncbi:MAG: hypothetical protein CMF12_13940 [Idiomarina sp.]|uniref:hypothetical protein n=1 Tax=Idiomarina sp. TaxID=1874361 RepID=UPI000C6C1217|nr:hypothetical protein [Idiomarina sp.]MBT43607.1 hypothetical protein [Idiomarina sp.]|tara:strand:+ start:68 stop:550 length:483 start_codon:yes stop_codon:yes gene_type:complete